MDIRKLIFTTYAMTALTVAVALTFPCVVEAVSIGEAVLQSKLGEPLLAQVDLTVGSNEVIEDACISLVAPDPLQEDTSGYLTKADLSFKTEGKRQYVTISLRKPFNDAFARFRLQIKCSGTGTVVKTLTILPDLDTAAPQTAITAPSAPAATESTSAPAPSNAHSIAPATNQRDTRNSQPEVKKHSTRKGARAVHKRRTPSARVTRKYQGGAATFRLKLSGEPLDESRIGKISAEERALLLARQKLLDADDQMASFLAMQNQVKQLQDELGGIKSQLAKLGVSPAASSATATAASALTPATTSPASSTTVDTQESRPKPAIVITQPTVQQNELPDGLFAALGLALVILTLWLGLRYYTKIKSRAGINSERDEERILKPADNNVAAALKMAISPVAKPPAPARITPAPAAVAPPATSTAQSNDIPAPLPPSQTIVAQAQVTEEDSMLEEAGLYASHGRPAKAIEILQEVINDSPSKADAWTLLLSIYSSLAKATEFEKTAREFLKHHPGSPAWSKIQALGRTFDQNNPLYVNNDSPISAPPLLLGTKAPTRQIGDVLVEMGLLSNQDIQNCLDDFDPKKHGRFGGYLVARKAITLAQLDQALLLQQGAHNEAKPTAMPSLQDMENFLADFDPKRDGSIGEFLASRNVTPEQLNQVLLQQSSPGTAKGTSNPSDKKPDTQ